MRLTIKVKKHTVTEWLCFAFFVLCFIPFLFPNPIVVTNIQPYAAMLGTFVFLLYFKALFKSSLGKNALAILGGTLLVSIAVMFISGVNLEAIRGIYNYYALFIIPCVVIISLEVMGEYPETLFKSMIWLWFIVSSIQFFIYRGFATELISAVRWSYMYRGVVGLASEPSFLGIACFYFLHVVRKFKTKRVLYSALILIMGTLYAQSTTGIIFIAGYYIVFLFEMINNKKGIYIWTVSLVAAAGFFVYLNTKLVNSRLYMIVDSFLNGGVDSVLSDGSANIRFNAINTALSRASENSFFPSGYGFRIGSAYGGVLVELGFFAIPIICFISYGLALTFKKKTSQVLYFVVVTILLLNNTQIGNPILLLVIGLNLYDRIVEKRKSLEMRDNARLYKTAQENPT